MRKILLASTALVALTSVSAMAADVTISGSMNFIYSNDAKDENTDGTALGSASEFKSETDLNVSFSATTDSGITTTLNVGIDESNVNDDATAAITGDFGEIKIISAGMDDNYVASMDNAFDLAGEGTEGEGFELAGPASGAESIGYKLPTVVDGLTIAVEHSNEDGTEHFGYGASYNAGIATVGYAKMKAAGEEWTSVNLKGSVAGIAFGIEKNEITGTGGTATSEDEATLWGLAYTMDSITLAYERGASKNESGDFDDYSQIAVSYAVAPGITAVVTSSEVNDVAGSGSADVEELEAQLKLSF